MRFIERFIPEKLSTYIRTSHDKDIPTQDVAFLYELKEFTFSVGSDNSFAGSNDTLLNRSSEINEAIRQQNRKTIKKGNLLPSNIQSQEWLVKGEQDVYSEEKNIDIPNLPYYFFTFYSNQEIGSLTIPKLHIIMSNTSQFTTYSESEMVEIWDRIIGSLRYKPNAF